MFRSISISLSPNVQIDDVFLALRTLLEPWKWKNQDKIQELESGFRKYQGAKYAFSFNSGRSALFTILKALEMKEGDEVLLQAFTCNAVPNPVLWAGGRPIYIDVDESLNIDPEDLGKKISEKSRAIIIQHTFGVPAQTDKILEIARRHNLIVIEDCAHALGARFNDKFVGTFGDVSFFSFGRDKVVSAVWGGMVTTNSEKFASKIATIYKDTPYPSSSWTFKQILHPLLFSIIIPTYYIFGKYFLILLKLIRGVGLAVSKKERMGEKPDMFPARMPNALAKLALNQFKKLDKYNEHRFEIASLYYKDLSQSSTPGLRLPTTKEGAIYLRFNVFHTSAKEIIKKARRKHIILGDWYKNIIDPIGTNFEKMRYTPGSCPNAEKAARESINLPTHINIFKKDAERIIQYLRNYQ